MEIRNNNELEKLIKGEDIDKSIKAEIIKRPRHL
jgi:hypothetical protein